MNRYPEIDILRTVAICGMVIYHTAYDLAFFYGWNISILSNGWAVFEQTIATLFLLLVGISSAISRYDRYKLWRRFLKVGGAALLVSLTTYWMDPSSYVRFGILHLIALSTWLLPCFFFLKEWAIFPAIALLLLGLNLGETEQIQPLSMILGLPWPGFNSVDYFPVLPWFGIILIGFALGHWIYIRCAKWRKQRRYSTPSWITWPGQHSLLLYLLHQPTILAVLYILLPLES